MIKVLNDQRVFIDYGPIQMAIDCSVNDERSVDISSAVAKEVLDEFHRLTPYVDRLKSFRFFDKQDESYPWVLNKMINAVEICGYDELNTLGAVAGSFSQYALKVAKDFGASKVIVNNGGDIAIFNGDKKPINVGMPIKDGSKIKIEVTKDMPVGGICTSGVSGRSFSKGIASFVSVFANEASVADACATYVANLTNADHENIVRCLAEQIDEGTDIKGQLITVKIGEIPEDVKYKAVLSGVQVAERLYDEGKIFGAVIAVDNVISMVPENLEIQIV